MRNGSHRGKWVLGLVCLSVVLAAIILLGVYNLRTTLDSFTPVTVDDIRAAIRGEIRSMQTLTTKWKDASGNSHEVVTTRINGESVEDFVARHQEAVQEAQEAFPPA